MTYHWTSALAMQPHQTPFFPRVVTSLIPSPYLNNGELHYEGRLARPPRLPQSLYQDLACASLSCFPPKPDPSLTNPLLHSSLEPHLSPYCSSYTAFRTISIVTIPSSLPSLVATYRLMHSIKEDGDDLSMLLPSAASQVQLLLYLMT